MSDAVMAAGLDNVEDMAAMADRLHDKPATTGVAAVTVQPPCCAHVAAVDAKQRSSNRSGRRYQSRRGNNRTARSPDRRADHSPERRAATPGRRMSYDDFIAADRPSSAWTAGASRSWCAKHQYWGDKAIGCGQGCTYSGN